MASVGVRDDTEIQSALIMGSQNDGVLNYRIDMVNGYLATKARKELVGLPRCGHESLKIGKVSLVFGIITDG